MNSHHRRTLQPAVHGRDHSAGPHGAPVTLVEYGDYECPHCFRAHPVVRALQRRMGDRLRFVFRNFPLAEMHAHALHAAEAAESVAAHAGSDAFWAMHHAIFSHQQDSPNALDDDHLVLYADRAGAPATAVLADLRDGTFTESVRADFSSGVRSGVNGTPTFFVNGERFEGDWTDIEAFVAALEEAEPSTRLGGQ